MVLIHGTQGSRNKRFFFSGPGTSTTNKKLLIFCGFPKVVTDIMLLTYEGKKFYFSDKKNHICDCTLGLNKCLKQIKQQRSLLTCAPFCEVFNYKKVRSQYYIPSSLVALRCAELPKGRAFINNIIVRGKHRTRIRGII